MAGPGRASKRQLEGLCSVTAHTSVGEGGRSPTRTSHTGHAPWRVTNVAGASQPQACRKTTGGAVPHAGSQPILQPTSSMRHPRTTKVRVARVSGLVGRRILRRRTFGNVEHSIGFGAEAAWPSGKKRGEPA